MVVTWGRDIRGRYGRPAQLVDIIIRENQCPNNWTVSCAAAMNIFYSGLTAKSLNFHVIYGRL